MLARFANPALKHSVHQIATDNSLKIPQRWLVAAVWMCYCRGEDEQGGRYALSDPLAGELQTLAVRHAGDVPATVKALMQADAIWGSALP